MTTAHTATHWVFRLTDGSKHSVGKYIEFEDGTSEGVATEQEAIGLLVENGYSVEDLE